MTDIAGWIAPIATMIAAILTAANLGTRITGWGFVIFTVGAIAWTIEAVLTHQQNLLWSNGFLAIVDAIGVYRWLGHRAKLEDGAKVAASKSEVTSTPLFPVLSLEGLPIKGSDGSVMAHVVGGMAECDSGRFAYLVVQLGAMPGARSLRMIRWADLQAGETFTTNLSRRELENARPVEAADWPSASTSNASNDGPSRSASGLPTAS